MLTSAKKSMVMTPKFLNILIFQSDKTVIAKFWIKTYDVITVKYDVSKIMK